MTRGFFAFKQLQKNKLVYTSQIIHLLNIRDYPDVTDSLAGPEWSRDGTIKKKERERRFMILISNSC